MTDTRRDGPWFMRRALDLVRGVRHRTSPNPTVGCVIVSGGEIVGEGVTQPAGHSHAEIVALAQAGSRANGADIYVTMEPCCHHGRTPPCTDAIVAAGISRAFAGAIDPNPLVAGEGLRRLEDTGVRTQVGLVGDECAQQIAPFRRFIVDRRSWVILKAAVTLDGRIATASGSSKWITGQAARQDAHATRAMADAVMVGAGTARADNPRLSVRLACGSDPLRVILDPSLSVSPDAALMGPGTLVYHADRPETASKLHAIRLTGASTQAVPSEPHALDLHAVLGDLASRGIVSVLVEGGGRLHGATLRAGLADEAHIYVAPVLIGRGRPVVDLPSVADIGAGWRLSPVRAVPLGDDVCLKGRIRYPITSNPVGEPEGSTPQRG